MSKALLKNPEKKYDFESYLEQCICASNPNVSFEVIDSPDSHLKKDFAKTDLVVLVALGDTYNLIRPLKFAIKKKPDLKFLLVTRKRSAEDLRQYAREGVNSFVHVSFTKEIVEEAVCSSMRDVQFIDVALDANSNPEQLVSVREKQIIYLVSKGLTSKDIAERMYLSVHTINTYRKNINAKFDVHNPVQLVNYAYSNNLIL